MNRYSDEELSLMGNAGVLLMKRQLIEKIMADFSALESAFRQQLHQTPGLQLPDGTLAKAGKISRGENYKGLPYLVLDYPRLMTKDEILNIRLLFWWGHYYSISLHLAGSALSRYRPHLKQAVAQGDFAGYYLQLKGSPWEHDVSLPGFSRVRGFPQNEAAFDQAHFVRLLNLLPLENVASLEKFAKASFAKFVSILREP